MPNSTELEIKLEVHPRRLSRVNDSLALKTISGAPKRTREVSVYFDTDQYALRAHGVILRVRRVGHRYIQTIKSRSADGLFVRGEWEEEVDGDRPDLALAAGTALESFNVEDLRRRLRPVFETRVTRTVYSVARDGYSVALSVDRGTVNTGVAIHATERD